MRVTETNLKSHLGRQENMLGIAPVHRCELLSMDWPVRFSTRASRTSFADFTPAGFPLPFFFEIKSSRPDY